MPPGSVAEVRGSTPRSLIQEYLARHVVNPDSIGDAYIRKQDVREAWSGHETIQRALHPAGLSPAESELIRQSLLIFLSILVYIGADDFLAEFRTNVLENRDNDGSLRYCDDKLPLEDKDVPALGSFMLRKRFLDEQFLFLPEVLVESATVKYISDQRRLPFEKVSRGVSAGAYGKIDKVGISPSYFKTKDGSTFPEIKYVACKRFHAQTPSYNDPRRELDNLQVLKESISFHTNIRLHLALIFHKGEHMILLPWAVHGDLEIFLNEGRDFMGREIYDFKRRFQKLDPGTMIRDVSIQMYHVADALKWLHDGFITLGTQNRIRFAHMDLKPNNILIDEDNGSTVGKWVLTDFGISAFKEDDTTESDNLVSVRDFFQNLTINTTPRRDPGAYQPPEVEHMAAQFSERRNTPQAGSAGRRGDVWSFACIYAEALAFSLGQAALLKEFRLVRKGRHKTDYFYEIDNSTLHPDNTTVVYRVRPQIVDWLGKLPERFSFPKRAIDCCVETIQRVLVVDGSGRPKAYTLRDMFNHVASHVNSARAPGGLPANCPLNHPVQSTPPPIPEPFIPKPDPPPPIQVKRAETIRVEDMDTHEELPISPSAHSRPDALLAEPHQIYGNSSIQDQDLLTPPQDRDEFGIFPGSPPSDTGTGLGIYSDPARHSGVSEATQTTMVSRLSTRGSKTNLYGVKIGPRGPRKPGTHTECTPFLPRSGKIVSSHLCPSGQQVIYLVDQKSQCEIYFFELLIANRRLQKNTQYFPLPNPIPLPVGTKWEKVAFAGGHLVAWGNTRGTKQQVFLTDRVKYKTLSSSEHRWLSTLITVAVSKQGFMAFVCTKSILCMAMDGDFFDNFSTQVQLTAKENHSFTHAAFNDDGNLLYAWEYGRPDDRLSVWRIEQSGDRPVFHLDSEGSYPSKQQGLGNATVIPYNSYHGCIIQAQDNDAFFPAQIRSTQRGSKQTLEKKVEILPKAVGACIYGDHSLLVTTKGTLHTRIWEHCIVRGSIHIIERSREPLVEFKCRPGEGVQMRVVPVPNSDDLVIILCLADGRIYMAGVVGQ